MGKVKKATKKMDIQAIKKQRRFQNKEKKARLVSEKSLANFKEDVESSEEEFELEDKKPIKNTQISSVNGESDDEDIEMDENQEEDDEQEEEQDSDDELQVEKSNKDLENSKKKDAKEVIKGSVKTQNLRDQVKSHQEDLKKLQEKDPELFKYLTEDDKKLLDFNVEQDQFDDDESDDDDDDDDESDEKEQGKGKETKPKQDVLTSALLDSWLEACQEDASLYNLKKLVIAFRSAARTGIDLKYNEESQFKITHSDIFHKVLIVCLQNLPIFFNQFLGFDEEKNESKQQGGEKVDLPKSAGKWKGLDALVNSFLKSLLQLVMQISDAKMLLLLLKGVEKSSIYISSHSSKLASLFLRHLLGHWSSSDEAVRIIAFLCIRKLAIYTPYPFIEQCLKGIYLNFVRNAKFINNQSLPIVNFMCNCVVEIFGLDFASSYKLAFQFIRQLAVHLRNTLNNTKTKDSVQNIYNWQFINSIRAWVEVIATYPGQEYLTQLIYPLSQILVGVIGLIPSSKYYPLRFHCIRLLNRLSDTNSVFINTIPYLLETLSTHKLSKQYSSVGAGGQKKVKVVNFLTSLSVPKSQSNTKEFQDSISSQFLELIVENLTSHSYSIGFPELCTPLVLHLQKYLKSNSKSQLKFVTDISELLEAIKKASKSVKDQRDQVKFSPKDTKLVREFNDKLREQQKSNPLHQLLQSLRSKSKRELQTLLESAKTYNYEDDEEEEDYENDDEEDDEDIEMEDAENNDEEEEEEPETFENEDDEEEELREIKKSKQQNNNKNNKKNYKKSLSKNEGDDIVEDLILSD